MLLNEKTQTKKWVSSLKVVEIYLLRDEIEAIDGLFENTDLFSFEGDPSDLSLSLSLLCSFFCSFGSSLTP